MVEAWVFGLSGLLTGLVAILAAVNVGMGIFDRSGL